jgi:transposase
VKASLPAGLAELVMPLLTQASALSEQIKQMDQRIEQLGQRYAEIGILRTAPGVGPLVAATYVLTLDRHQLLGQSRSAGALLGLRPGRSQSGDYDPQCRITKTGNSYLRSLLVQSAHYILSRFGPDTALRRWGLKLAASGGKRGKRRAVVAVARKLSVILHCVWRSGQRFHAFPQSAVAVVAAEA